MSHDRDECAESAAGRIAAEFLALGVPGPVVVCRCRTPARVLAALVELVRETRAGPECGGATSRTGNGP